MTRCPPTSIITYWSLNKNGWHFCRRHCHSHAFFWFKVHCGAFEVNGDDLRWCAVWLTTLRPRQDGRHFPDDIFKHIFFNENVRISIQISLKFVPEGPINNNLALVQITAWCRLGNKPLSEPMVVRLPTHICATRPQWVKSDSQT